MYRSLWNGARAFAAALLSLCLATAAHARLGPQYAIALGNPDGASTNSASRTKYLINQRAQYAISYNDDTHQANWVGWSYSTNDDGTQARTDYWQKEELLPSGYLQIGTATFGTGWDRGHMTPSADRTKDLTNNQVTFRMSNIIPQASQNNQGLWNNFESYCRTLAANNNEVLIVSGPAQFTGSRLGNQMSIAGSVWKIAVVVSDATNSTPANERINTNARVIAILTPNTSTGLGPWQSYITSVEQIEAVTGYNFFNAINNRSVAIYLKNLVDTGTGPNSPTVLTTFNPTLGASGTSVTISGYNFGASPVVQFNGIQAAVQRSTANSITATVPSGATTGYITVQGANGTDTSYEQFTVTTGASPTLTLSPTALSGLSANQGSAGTAVAYALTGTALTNTVTVTAPANFEVSKDGGTTFADTQALAPDINGSLGVQIYARIKSAAPAGNVSGTIAHSGGGATTANLTVSGAVVSTAPTISLSTNSITGLSALQNSAGSSKSYTFSGANLSGSVSVSAPAGFEVSADNTNFANSVSLSPSAGSLSNAIVYVRLAASATAVAKSGNITHSGGGLSAAPSVSVSGDVISTTPTLAVSTNAISGFTAMLNSSGGSKAYTVSGSFLTNSISVSAPAGFEIGTNTTTFANALVLTPASGTLTSTAIYARLAASATSGPVFGAITHIGGGATQQDVNVSGDVTAPAPTLILSTNAISGFTAVQNSPGASKTYSISGSFLTSSVSVSAPVGYEIGTSTNSFASSLILTPSAGNLASTTIYARLAAAFNTGTVSGSITHIGGGVAQQDVTVAGDITSSAPSLIVSTNTITGFTAVQNNPGGSKTYTVSGSFLTNNVSVNAPAGFEIGTNTTTFTSSLLLTPTSGTLPSTTIYARIAASATLGTNSGTITHVGGGATPQNLEVVGTVSTSSSGTMVRVAAWDFTGESNVATSVAEVFDAALDANNTLTRGVGAGASAGNNSFRTTGFQNNGISTTNTDYFQFSLSSATGASLSMSSITARFAGTSSYFASPGAANQFAYSTNGTNFVLIGSAFVVTNTSSPVTVDVSGENALQNLDAATTVTFRFYASGQTSTGGWGFSSPSAGSYGLDVKGIISVAATPAPIITVSEAATATALVPFSYQISANNTPTSYAASGLPPGLSVNTSTGSISGTPATAGTYTIDLLASNAGGDGTATLTLTVNPPPAPVITSTTSATVEMNTLFRYQIAANNAPTAFSATGYPAEFNFDPAAGIISGTPTTAGVYTINLTASNETGDGTATLTLTVSTPPPPSITSGTTASATAYSSFSYQITANNSASYFSASGLPAGLSVDNATGTISGTPIVPGTYNVTLTASNAYGDGTATLTLTVDPAPVPVITSAPTATATAYSPFSYQITADNSPTAFNAIGYPAELTFDAATGIIGGTPTTTGTYTILLTASNLGGDGTATLTLTVDPNPGAPAISGALSVIATVEKLFSYQITASNSPTAYLADNLPAGLSVDPTTGTISGTPTAAGTSNVAVTAINTLGSDTKTLTITILAPALEISATDLAFESTFGAASAAQSYTLTGSDLASAITVLAAENFEINDDGGNIFFDELTITPVANRTVNATIHVRMKSSAPLGENSGSITHVGADAVPKYINLTGLADVTGATIDLSVSSLSGFSTKVGTPSFAQSYNVSGIGLTEPVVVTAPNGFQVSTNSTTYTNSVTLTPNNGAIAAQEVFVRLLSQAAGTYTNSISHIGGGAEDKYLAVNGTVTQPLGPPITSFLSGSCYTNGIFSNKVTAGGSLLVTSYGASNLPSGLTINTTNGVISGTAQVTAGTYTFGISATTQDGTTTTNYTLRVVSATEQNNIPLGVVINKFQNGTPDRVELLVTGDTNDIAPGPPVDLRGMILKDFDNSMASDTGGKYQFKSVPFWSSVKAGTLIVLSTGTSLAEDFDASDWIVSINLDNPDYFTKLGGVFDILSTDMLMIKRADMGIEGVAGGVYALGVGTAGTLYSGFAGKKTRSSNALQSNRPFAYVINDGSRLSDFYLSTGADIATTLTFGSSNNSKNRSFITSLRNLDQTPPVVTLNGNAVVNLALNATYIEQGASVTGGTSGAAAVSGTVNTSAAGTYIITYSATDSSGNLGTTMRTVTVAKGTPVISQLPTASAIIAGQKLSASTLTGGVSSVAGTFAWTVPNQTVSTVGEASYDVTFTPNDTANYNTVTGMVDVTANQGTAFETWALGYGLVGADAASAADPDRDGLNNLLEFDLGRNPTRGDGWVRSIAPIGGQLKVTYLQRKGANLTVQTSTDLVSGFNATATSVLTSPQPGDIANDYEQYEVTVPPVNGRIFLRIRATQP